VRAQLRREMEKKGDIDVNIFSKFHDILALHVSTVGSQSEQSHGQPDTPQMENLCNGHLELQNIIMLVSEISGVPKSDAERITSQLIEGLENMRVTDSKKPVSVSQSSDETKASPETHKKSDAVAIPEDFRCPISLELMRDPVIVSTGQVMFQTIIVFNFPAQYNLRYTVKVYSVIH
jgi:hypothetical protein